MAMLLLLFGLGVVIGGAIIMAVLAARVATLKRENAELKRSGHSMPVELERPPIPHWNAANNVLDNDAELVDLIRRDQKIQAIKLYRERTGVGLKEAKDAVEAMIARGR